MRALLFASLLGLAACGNQPADAPTPQEATVDATDPAAMGKLAAQLAASPDQADSLLAAQGLDRASFDAAMYEIAADSTKSAAFEAARR